MTAFDFSPLLRSTIGFERLMKNFDRVMNADATAEHYPPCNIVKTGEHTYRIEMAVAGFGEEDLAIEAKGDELVIAGKVQGQGRRPRLPAPRHRDPAVPAHLPPRRACEGRRREAGERHARASSWLSEVPEALKPRRIEIGAGAPEAIEAA